MGDPRKLRKKYYPPSHPWQKIRIDEEKILMKDYGFKNKKELWKLNSILRNFKTQVKKLISRDDEAAIHQKEEFVKRLQDLKLISEKAVLEDILSVTLKDLCERRLQTLVFKKGLARSIKQARQFITHEHIMVGDNKITAPSYIVSSGEELTIKFAPNSKISSEDHPERGSLEKEVQKEKERAGLVKKEEKVEPVEEFKEEKREEPKKEEKTELEEAEEVNKDEVPSEEESAAETPVEEIKEEEPKEEEKAPEEKKEDKK